MTRTPLPYSEKLLDYFRNPRNLGSLEEADAIASAGSPACGDMITYYLKVNNDILEDIRFESYGCAANIASASYLTEKVKGKPLEEAFNLNWRAIAKELGGLPAVKAHCGVLAVGALRRAIRVYFAKKGEKPPWLPENLTSEERHAQEEEDLVKCYPKKFQV